MKTFKLWNKTKNILILNELENADTFITRGIGLIGRSGLKQTQGLLIQRTNAIHTCFMKFAIDCIFIDDSLQVKAIKKNIQPWRLTWPVWSASKVIEVQSGNLAPSSVSLGDLLYVDT